MKLIEKDFNSPEFAKHYITNHQKLLRRIGSIYALKLLKNNFTQGKILDAGCGTGTMIIEVAGNLPNCECIGVDSSEIMLNHAGRLKSEFQSDCRVKFMKADVKNLPFDDDSFNVVFNLNMAHWIDDPVVMFNEISRVLKPTGYLFIKDLRRSWLSLFEDEISGAFTSREAKAIIANSVLKPGRFTKSLLWWEYELYPEYQ